MALRACDISRIRDWLYLGSHEAEKSSIQALKELQITHVVQVGTNQFMSPSHEGALKYCCVSALDHEGEDLLIKLKQHNAHSFIDDARSEGGVVLVHCFAGVSRSATTVISYLMKEEGLTFEDALADLISRRDCVAPNRGFCDQLKILQDQCDSKLEKYEPEMLRDYKEEMSMKQWLALLLRTRGAGQTKSEKAPEAEEDVQALKLGLQGFARRLEERKKRGYEGDYKGYLPPPDESNDGEASPG